MKKIKLTQGKYAIVDDEDYEWLNQWKWYVEKSKGDTWYAARSTSKNKNRKHILMHRQIMQCSQELQIDHINHKGYDNRRKNLRLATNSQNQMNRKKSKNTSSKYKGVSLNKKSKKWEVYIKINNKRKSLGYYKNEKDAALIYDYWANKLFKEFACLNFPNETLTRSKFKKLDLRKEKSSQYIGVGWHKRDKKWYVSIRINGKRKYVGKYEKEIEAVEARDQYIINNNLQNKYKLNF